MNAAANEDQVVPDIAEGGKPLDPMLRLQCLVLAQMNDEKAELCRDDQPALRAFFEKNAEVLRVVAAS